MLKQKNPISLQQRKKQDILVLFGPTILVLLGPIILNCLGPTILVLLGPTILVLLWLSAMNTMLPVSGSYHRTHTYYIQVHSVCLHWIILYCVCVDQISPTCVLNCYDLHWVNQSALSIAVLYTTIVNFCLPMRSLFLWCSAT